MAGLMSNYWLKYHKIGDDQMDPPQVTTSFFFTKEERDKFVEKAGEEIEIIQQGDSYANY